MEKKNIAIVAGGYSSEREISLKGAAFYKSFLDREKYNVTLVDVARGMWFAHDDMDNVFEIDKNDFSYTDGEKHTFDLVINVIHGNPGENGLIQGYFDLVGLPYLTGGVVSSAVSFDKEFTKIIASSYGVKCADGIVIHKGDRIDYTQIERFGFPIFVKPNGSGSSYGVTKVSKVEDLDKAIEYAFTEDSIILIEKGIIGREVACGAYSLGGEVVALPITEIVSHREFFDYEAKYQGDSDEITPADLPNDVVEKLNRYTKLIYKALRCKAVVRIDYMIEESGEVYLIEINNIPGMSGQSLIPQQVAAMGLKISELYDDLIAEGVR